VGAHSAVGFPGSGIIKDVISFQPFSAWRDDIWIRLIPHTDRERNCFA